MHSWLNWGHRTHKYRENQFYYNHDLFYHRLRENRPITTIKTEQKREPVSNARSVKGRNDNLSS